MVDQEFGRIINGLVVFRQLPLRSDEIGQFPPPKFNGFSPVPFKRCKLSCPLRVGVWGDAGSVVILSLRAEDQGTICALRSGDMAGPHFGFFMTEILSYRQYTVNMNFVQSWIYHISDTSLSI